MTSISPERILQIEARRDELSALMASGDLPSDRFVQVSKDYAELEPIARAAGEVRRLRAELDVLAAMEEDSDPEIKTMAREEIAAIRDTLPQAERALALSLLPRDAADERAAMLEIRAGTGGDEAALFAADLFRMYRPLRTKVKGWRVELMSVSDTSSESGGFKEVDLRPSTGERVYSRIAVRRPAPTVSNGCPPPRPRAASTPVRRHGGRPTRGRGGGRQVIKDEDLRIDVFRSGGAGRPNRSTRLIRRCASSHIPTGLTVVSCQDEKSQHKNKAKAMRVLRTRLYEAERDRLHQERAGARKSMVGSGDRSERIRTYNFRRGG